MRKAIIVASACFLLLMSINGAQANLIANGSFEEGPYTSNDPFVTLYSNTPSSSTIPGWKLMSFDDGTVTSIDWINTYWNASEGTKSLDLAGYYKHGLIYSDPFTTEIGKTYRVQFDMAGNPDQSYLKSLLAFSNNDLNVNTFKFDFDQSGHTKDQSGHTNMGWVSQYYDFIADTDTAQLVFLDVTNYPNAVEAWGAALDNVSVDLAPVPEPSTFLLLAAGLAGAGIFRRKMRRQTGV